MASVSNPFHGLCPNPLPVLGLGRRAHTPPACPVPLPLTLAGLHVACARTQLFSVPMPMGRTHLECCFFIFQPPLSLGFPGSWAGCGLSYVRCHLLRAVAVLPLEVVVC